MLDHHEKRELELLAAQMWRSDPDFAAALDHGQPRAPQEYRRPRRIIAIIVALAILVPIILGYPLVSFLLGWLTAAGGIVWYGHRLDRPPRTRR